jgi:hypothetical protein
MWQRSFLILSAVSQLRRSYKHGSFGDSLNLAKHLRQYRIHLKPGAGAEGEADIRFGLDLVGSFFLGRSRLSDATMSH